MSDVPVNKLTDTQLAEEHSEMEGVKNDPNTSQADYFKASRRCVDCEREIDRRRKGKEWAANYFGPKKYNNKGGYHPPEDTE